MRFLLDTHILIWAAAGADELPDEAAALIVDGANELFFSAVSIWEVAIKTAKGLSGFAVDADRLRLRLREFGYVELPVTGVHAAAVGGLPDFHKDPFDRLLVAQAVSEGMELVTVDAMVGRYFGVRRV